MKISPHARRSKMRNRKKPPSTMTSGEFAAAIARVTRHNGEVTITRHGRPVAHVKFWRLFPSCKK